MITRPHRFVLAAALTLSTSLLAAPKGAPRLVRMEELRPSADSRVTLDRVTYEELSDGTHRVRASLRSDGRSRSGGIHYRYDLQALTYTAVSIDDPDAAGRGVPPVLLERARKWRQHDVALDEPTALGDSEPPPNCGTPEGPQPCDNPCGGTSNGLLVTIDPVYIKIAETRGTLRYHNGGANGCRFTATALPSCYANPNTGLSHWFQSGCNGGAYTLAPGAADGYTNGSYYNYDFGWNDQITRLSHRINMIYRSPNSFYEYVHDASGEKWWLLDGTFYWYETGGCFF